ncbi:MAG: ClcB-like voltage-gated chloride channel protein [Proteobacteria bacterium]|nr:ClcB-like voltage-gated chloride channel protein [Pseudomonadota bacterium]
MSTPTAPRARVLRLITRPAQWVTDRLRPLLEGHEELLSIVFWAAIIGIGGAFASVLFREAIHVFQWMLTRRSGGLVQVANDLAPLARVLVPTAGGLVAGIILYFASRLRAGKGNVDYMEAMVVGDGVIGARPTLLRSLSSLATIASGGSIGREGPMVQLAALLGSKIGLVGRVPLPRRRLFVACGAAAGIASAYNAPIAGAVFVAEIVMGSFAMESFGPLLVASVSADATIHRFLGYGAVFQVPPIHFGENWELILYALLGILLGHLAPPFLALLDWSKSRFDRLAAPLPLRLAIGGVLVGITSLAFPEVWGNGYSVVDGILHGNLWGWLLFGVLIAKALSTAATVGSGAVGGVFTPTLFIGAAVGSLVGLCLRSGFAHMASDNAAFAIVGMGGFLAATTHAPLTAVLMIFEMTLDHAVVLPLILACVTAHYTSVVYRRGASVYKNALAPAREVTANTIAGLVRANAVRIRDDTSLAAMIASLPRGPLRTVYVVNDGGELIAALEPRVVAADVRHGDLDERATVATVATPVRAALTPEQSLTAALDLFLKEGVKALPVIASPWRATFLGEVSRHDVLLALQDRLSGR